MRIPVIKGIIDRRILVNYRVDADILTQYLPEPFKPILLHGFGIAGICLIRLKHVRPRYLPSWVGVASENAAHRIAVEWEQGGEKKEGVFIPRRDTSSRLNSLLGGRIFPGNHHSSQFQIEEESGKFKVSMDSDDGQTHLLVDAKITDSLPTMSIFRSLQEASDFFEQGSLGYSPAYDGNFEGLELKSFNWQITPLSINNVESSFFADIQRFPKDSVEFDSAFYMNGIHHEWYGRGTLQATSCIL